MRITYIANVRLPTEKAHGLQIMKMCEALGKHQAPSTKHQTNSNASNQERLDVEFIEPRRKHPISDDPFAY